ncbi:MAG: hypothetical protein FWG07_09595 [Treponema sp.]|nr:hypothetical protein [Treponema sp.]
MDESNIANKPVEGSGGGVSIRTVPMDTIITSIISVKESVRTENAQ